MKVADVVEVLETVAPPRWAQEWDNVGLLLGDPNARVRKLMLCVDLTRDVLNEIARTKVDMVLAYHPVIFKGLSRVTADRQPLVYEAIRRGVSVYSAHTAFDVVPGGTNDVLAGAMGLADTRPLEETIGKAQCKIVTFVPPDELQSIADAAFAAGAGKIGDYYDCAFLTHGIGSFCGGTGTHPSVGQAGHHEMGEELRLEVIADKAKAASVCEAIRKVHSYETPTIDVYPLDSYPEGFGMGRVGTLKRPVGEATMISRIKKALGLNNVLVAWRGGEKAAKGSARVATAACGAGSCGDLFQSALSAGASFYLTGEMRHHDVLAATAAGLTVVCLGHSNSERIAVHHLADRLSDLLHDIAVTVSKNDKDPLVVA